MSLSNGTALKLLDGVRVIDFTQALSGPYCTMMLADLGAEVIKIESPARGDDSRHWGPPFIGEDAAYFAAVNRNKKSVALDLKTPAGLTFAQNLALSADVLVENWRPGTAERLGLGATDLRKSHPRLVYCSISGFGQGQGPRSGYDQVVQGTSGAMSITGPFGQPTKWGIPVADIAAGIFAHSSIVAALYRRELSETGATIDIAMQDCMVSMLTHHASGFLNGGSEPRSAGNGHPSIAPYGTFRASDGLLNICVGSDDQFQRMCQALDCPHLSASPHYRSNKLRVAHNAELQREIENVLSLISVNSALDQLADVGVPAGKVASVADALNDPATQDRNMLLDVSRDLTGDPITVVNTPWKFDGEAPSGWLPPPRLGEHTDAILNALITPVPQ